MIWAIELKAKHIITAQSSNNRIVTGRTHCGNALLFYSIYGTSLHTSANLRREFAHSFNDTHDKLTAFENLFCVLLILYFIYSERNFFFLILLFIAVHFPILFASVFQCAFVAQPFFHVFWFASVHISFVKIDSVLHI